MSNPVQGEFPVQCGECRRFGHDRTPCGCGLNVCEACYDQRHQEHSFTLLDGCDGQEAGRSDVFVPDRLYTRSDWHIRVGPHDLTEICRTDARFLGMAIDHLLQREFRNLTPPPGNRQGPVDLLETHADGCRSWEVKTTRQITVNIQPSYAKGAGRKHNPERFANTLDSLSGFILVDQRQLPKVSFRGLSVAEIRARGDGDVPKTVPIDTIYYESLK